MKRFKPSEQYNMATGSFVATEPKPRTQRKKTTTNSLTAQIAHYVELRGGYAMRINVGGFYREDVGYIRSGSTVGVPDIIAVFEGMYIGIEVKTGKDFQSEAQKTVGCGGVVVRFKTSSLTMARNSSSKSASAIPFKMICDIFNSFKCATKIQKEEKSFQVLDLKRT